MGSSVSGQLAAPVRRIIVLLDVCPAPVSGACGCMFDSLLRPEGNGQQRTLTRHLCCLSRHAVVRVTFRGHCGVHGPNGRA